MGGEPFIFGFDPAGLAAYLQPLGFALVSNVSSADAAKSSCEPLARAETGSALYPIAVARRAHREGFVSPPPAASH